MAYFRLREKKIGGVWGEETPTRNYRSVPLNSNMDNPDSWLIEVQWESHLELSYVNPKFTKFPLGVSFSNQAGGTCTDLSYVNLLT